MPELFRVETDRVLLVWTDEGDTTVEIRDSIGLPPGRLVLRPRRAGLEFGPGTWRAGLPPQVARDPNAIVGPHLFEERSYGVFVQSLTDAVVELRHRDPFLLGRIRQVDNRGRVCHGIVNFRSQVGRSEFSVLVDGLPELDFEVEVFPSKLDYEADYHQLLADVQNILTGLVVEYLRATFELGGPAPVERQTHLEWLALLRHVLDDLERALRQIARQPRWGLVRAPVAVRTEHVRRADTLVRRAVLRGRGSGGLRTLAGDLAVREKLREHRARPTLDTPEHRWLTTQLARIRRRLAELRAAEQKQAFAHKERGYAAGLRAEQAIQELGQLERRIAALEKLEPFASARGPTPARFASLQLLAAPGYREAYRCCLLLNLGLRLTGDPVRLSIKELHLLYEYWCFLAVLRCVAELTGQALPARDLLVPEEDGLRVQIQKGRTSTVQFSTAHGRRLHVTYNPTFKGGAFLTPQRPDLMLSLEDPAWPTTRLVMDAKYRVDTSSEYTQRCGSAGPPDDDINVLHRYRDAILEKDDHVKDENLKRTVVEGVVLFPLRVHEPERFRQSLLWRALERIGIGALPFLPGETRYVEGWLARVLRRGGWTLADRTVPHRLWEWSREWRVAASEPVLLAMLRASLPQEHLEWIKRERLYYTPVRHTQRRQFAAHWVAIYSPTSLRVPGAVTHVAAVEHVEVLPRRDIPTPWPASRRPDELQVVYRLGPVQDLPRPIENRAGGRGMRFSTNRWTSRLALLRASELRELFLETEPEWRLWEELRAAGIGFVLEPGPVHLPDPEDPAGRAWFRADNDDRGWRVQYRGAAGFLVRCPDQADHWLARTEDVVAWISVSGLGPVTPGATARGF